MSSEGIDGGPEYCPACLAIGEKTPRVGTFKCTDRECRVHFYQQGVSSGTETEREMTGSISEGDK